MNGRLTPIAAAALACALSAPVSAQWMNYPTPGIPRLPDGKPNLSEPAPRTADGKPKRCGRSGSRISERIVRSRAAYRSAFLS